MTFPIHQLHSFCYRKSPPKFEIESLFRHFLVYTDTKKTHNIVKSIHSSLRSESKRTYFIKYKLIVIDLLCYAQFNYY
ncbi:hypothetical protein FWK35_00024486 [Aphis craccivora]|uniref:Uncharacterized protein n=1 Tax=Aphis craccivora TaxID=307492 RepID=A0A6G0YFX0_APHCR|nr:hypothetical protein FWK35_00024486 [Aphis craccivora]